MDSAKTGWKSVRDMILLDDLDASVYRSFIDGKAYVVLVGNQCLQPLQKRFSDSCTGAILARIPERVAAYRSKIPGMFWERRGTS
jgi:hypothetical protein